MPPMSAGETREPVSGFGSGVTGGLVISAVPTGQMSSRRACAKAFGSRFHLSHRAPYQHELPNVPGKSIKGMLVEYGPGGYSPGHTHPKSAFIYATVLEGAIRSQVNDGPVTTRTENSCRV